MNDKPFSDTKSIELDIIDIPSSNEEKTSGSEDVTIKTKKDSRIIKKNKKLIIPLIITILILSIAVLFFLKKYNNNTFTDKKNNSSTYYETLDPIISILGKNKSIRIVLIIECKSIKFKEKIKKHRLIILESIKNKIKTDQMQQIIIENNHKILKEYLKNHINTLLKKTYVSNVFYSDFLILKN